MFRKLIILSILVCFTYSTFDEWVKIYLEQAELIEIDIENEDSEKKQLEKEVDFDKIAPTNLHNSFSFESFFRASKKCNYEHQKFHLLIYNSISTPPPESI